MTRERDSKQAFTVELDLQTYRRLKLAALDERRPMSKVVRDAIRNWCDLHDTPTELQR